LSNLSNLLCLSLYSISLYFFLIFLLFFSCLSSQQNALLDSKKSYVRYISHELRTPLNTAFLGLKLLGDDFKVSKDPRDAERWETLNDVSLSCAVAVDILNDLLCYEKLESGILELHKENITVNQFLTGCMSMIFVQAKECGVTMTLQTDVAPKDGCPLYDNDNDLEALSLQSTDCIFADKFKMDQVIRNLISNALKFTPRGGAVTIKSFFVYDPVAQDVNRTVSTSGKCTSVSTEGSRRQSKGTILQTLLQQRKTSRVGVIDGISPTRDPIQGKLVIIVTDTGVGISTENQQRLFKEIIQFNPEKLQAGGGSGLGLWITQEILDLHDGRISVFSEGEGTGTSFTVEMPMYRYPPEQKQKSVCLVGPTLSSNPIASTVEDLSDEGDEASVTVIGISSQTSCNMFGRSLSTLGGSSRELYLLPESRLPALDILVVDDSRLSRKMLMKCLKAEGYNCTEAEDGLDALVKVKERIRCGNGEKGQPFDIILMDFVMPNMDGPTATKEIRTLGYTAPIFGVTGNGEFKLHFDGLC
jgi:signal transduction histidine kinase/CheY-like chemotaxis protein